MGKYDWLLKKKTKSLGLFGKLIKDLTVVKDRFSKEQEKCSMSIDNSKVIIAAGERVIVEEKDNINFLETEKRVWWLL